MRTMESEEDYLETILVLLEEKGYCRGVDIARHMEVTRPSVSRAVSNLKTKGYITLNEDNFVLLTQAGEEIARRIYCRHTSLTRWLIKLGVDPKVAETDACHMEHAVSEETFEKLVAHFDSCLV